MKKNKISYQNLHIHYCILLSIFVYLLLSFIIFLPFFPSYYYLSIFDYLFYSRFSSNNISNILNEYNEKYLENSKDRSELLYMRLLNHTPPVYIYINVYI